MKIEMKCIEAKDGRAVLVQEGAGFVVAGAPQLAFRAKLKMHEAEGLVVGEMYTVTVEVPEKAVEPEPAHHARKGRK